MSFVGLLLELASLSYFRATFNVFSPSAQRTEAANNSRIWYASLLADTNHLERIQRSATRFVTGIRQLPYEERLQRLGLHSLQR